MEIFPYQINANFKQRVAYFSMEYAIDQSLKIYSGGLGFLAGSHLRSAFSLKQNFIAIGILWTFGYYDQILGYDGKTVTHYIPKYYNFLTDTGILIDVNIHHHTVFVKVYKLEPEIFGTAPLYLLTTDFSLNDYLSRTICHKLYDPEISTRIAQYIILGDGGAKLVKILGGADFYHLNESHALPCMFRLLLDHETPDVWQQKVVFTTHTPEMAGNEVKPMDLLEKMGFFLGIQRTTIDRFRGESHDYFNFTAFAIKNCRKTNAVSKMHAQVSQNMWQNVPNANKIFPITNAQNKNYWMDEVIHQAWIEKDFQIFSARKKLLKKNLFKTVSDQCGKIFNPDTFTIVWARRFAGYKRATLLLKSEERLRKLLNNSKYPVQFIWAGKPYPKDEAGINEFNRIIEFCHTCKNAAILTGYELSLSATLKKGADAWLNTPRIFREASGTSGMTAAMNGTVNISIKDGWMNEFANDKINCFIIPTTPTENLEELDNIDSENLFQLLENVVVPFFYENKESWFQLALQAITDVLKYFDSDRMATEYYEKAYN